jgi:alpha-glucosidase
MDTIEQEWWRGSVTYQIYPRSFLDSNGDGIGDIPGITSRLDYLADLGVDAIWLSPIFTSPMKDMGYDVSNYIDIDPSFGTLSDFDEMIAKAHSLGLKVIIDQVLSHTSDQHPYFLESRQNQTNDKADWYIWADAKPDGSPPNNWLSIFGGTGWQWDSRRKQYYMHNFLRQQPDLNFHNPNVQEWILSTVRFWLERGVDGFRLDTVNYYFHDKLLRDDAADFRQKSVADWNPYHMQYHLFSKNQPENLVFLKKFRALLDEYGATTSVGEVGESHHPIEMMGEYTTDKRLHMAYSFEMLGNSFSPKHFSKQITEFFRLAPEGWPCWAFSNHDVVRHVSRWKKHAEDPTALAKQACALLLSLEGSVCLYQGEELGQQETDLSYDELVDPQGIEFWPEDKGRDGCRTPMSWDNSKFSGFSSSTPWLPVKETQRQLNVADQQNKPSSVLNFYREMLAFRKQNSVLRNGNTLFINDDNSLLAFVRGDTMLCIFNLGNQSITYQNTTEFNQCIKVGNTKVEGKELVLGANGFAFLTK